MSKDMPYILLVDDEPYNLMLLEDLLISEGYRTTSATSGEEAITISKDALPDLILLDVMMPGMDGFEVCRRLRGEPTLANVPVIFLTALDDDESRLQAMEMMGDAYFTKPIKSDLLLKKIATTLQLNHRRSQATQVETRQQLREQTRRQLAVAWQINEYISEKFKLFVPEQFLTRIAPRGIESIQLGNAREEELTILFCDIRKFTTISESQTASETFTWLNVFFSKMSQAIASNYGFVDKYLGDAIMAVFDRKDHHAQDALTAAIMMEKNLDEFNKNHQQYKIESPVKMGIGIHTGNCMIGTVGSERRMDSTVIGDVVNTASRLEQLTKLYDCQILASQAVIENLNQPELFIYRLVDKVTPNGKQKIIELYEILEPTTALLTQG